MLGFPEPAFPGITNQGSNRRDIMKTLISPKEPIININFPLRGCAKSISSSLPVVFWEKMRMELGRPNYKIFKSNVYNTEEVCVSVIIGTIQINLLFNALMLMRSSSSNPDHGMFIFEIRQISKIIHDGIIGEDICYIREGSDSILEKVETLPDIKEGIKKEADGLADILPGHAHFWMHDYHKQQPFSQTKKINSLSFLDWAKRNSYPIPDELDFYKNDKGELKWVEPTNSKKENGVTGGDQLRLMELKKELAKALEEICPEVERFYKGLLKWVREYDNKGWIDIEGQDLYDMALEYFNENSGKYTLLKLSDIDNKELYSYVRDKRRKIVGTILSQYVKSNYKNISKYPKIQTGSGALFILHKKIIK